MTTPAMCQLRWIFVATLLALGLPVASSGRVAEAQSPATGHAQVIAQGTAWLPAQPLSWWVGRHQEPGAGGGSPYRQLGFVLGESGTTTVITETARGDQLVWLDAGEALFVPLDAYQERFSTGSPASYYSIALLPEGSSDPAAQPVGSPILPNGSLHELSLLRDVLGPGEAGFLPNGGSPALILATSGEITVTPEQGSSLVLGAGEAATVDAAATIVGVTDGASYVATVVTPRPEQAPRAGLADLGLWVFRCPPGITAQPVMTDLECELIDPLTAGLDVRITSPALPVPLTLASSSPGDVEARVWSDVPFAPYTLTATLPPGTSGYALRPTIEGLAIDRLPDGSGYTFTIDGQLFDPRSDYWRVNLELYLLYP